MCPDQSVTYVPDRTKSLARSSSYFRGVVTTSPRGLPGVITPPRIRCRASPSANVGHPARGGLASSTRQRNHPIGNGIIWLAGGIRTIRPRESSHDGEG